MARTGRKNEPASLPLTAESPPVETGGPSSQQEPASPPSAPEVWGEVDWCSVGRGQSHSTAEAIRQFVKEAGGRVEEKEGKRTLVGVEQKEIIRGLAARNISTNYGPIQNALGLSRTDSSKSEKATAGLLSGAEALVRVISACKEHGGSAGLLATVQSAKTVFQLAEEVGGFDNLAALLQKAAALGL